MANFRQIIYIIILSIWGNINGFSQYNNVFIIDCSRSMICPNAEKTNNWEIEERGIRWNPAKDALKNWISEYEDTDVITLLLFNDRVVSTISKKKKDINWDDINKELDNAVKDHHGKTSICNAWSVAERYFDPNKYNFFYIITDGVDDHSGPCHLVEQIRAFCNKMPDGSHGYVLKLDQASFQQDVLEALNSSPCLTQLPAGPIPKFGGFISDEVFVTTSNMKSGGVDKTSILGFDRKARYNISVQTINEPYFDVSVTNGCVNNGVLTFDVKLKNGVNLNDLKRQLDSESYEISAVLSSRDVKIVRNNNISIIVTLKPISELQLLNDLSQIELGKASWYDNFIISRTNPDTLSYIFEPHFNEEAIANGSSATIKIFNLPSVMRLLVNGNEYPDNTFLVNSNAPMTLQFITESPCEDFDIESSLRIMSTKDLDIVNGLEDATAYSIAIGGEVNERINPCKCCFILVLGILLVLLIIRIFYNLIRPSMNGKLNIVDENDNTIRGLGDISGLHKIYLYNGPNESKCGLLDTLIFAKRKYIHINGLQYPIVITGNSNKTIFIHPSKGLIINDIKITNKLRLRARTVFSITFNNINIFRIRYF